jgi:hypothetical protein
MANSLLTIDMITRKSLEILENNLVISRNATKSTTTASPLKVPRSARPCGFVCRIALW